MAERPDGSPPADPAPSAEGHLGSALLYCEQCGAETPHRIFRVRRGARGGTGALEGVARCRQCRATHPFESRPPKKTELFVIVSDGPRSVRRSISLAPGQRIQTGAPVPDYDEPVIARRLDARDGRLRTGGRADEISTVWATRQVGAVVKVSMIIGRITRPGRIVVPPETRFEIGGELDFEGTTLVITALRARGKTWRLEGDAFRADEIQRLYGRRSAMPPAGNSDWRSERPMPRSRTSSSSRSERSRSSPGVTRNLTTPRARTDVSGAAVHRSWSW